jgi:PAS domain S-box-containing protein
VRGVDGAQTGAVLTLRDDTARHETEAALAESERRFRNLADNAPLMMWVTEPDGYCSYLNRRWYEYTGQSEEEALGLGWTRATHPDDQKLAEEAFLAATAARAPFRVEYRLRRADGVYRWAIDAAAPRFSEAGTFLGHVGSVIDIDERREAEERLRESEARLRTLTNSLPAFVWFATPDGALRHFNDRWYEYTGQTPEEALPNGWVSSLHPDDVDRTAVAWAEARARTVRYEIEVRYRRHDGAYRWYVARAEPVRGEDGAVTGWFGTSIDIHDRKRAEARIQEINATLEHRIDEALAERKLWADVFESSDALICALSPDYRFLALNRSYADEFERIFGVRPEVGSNLVALLAPMPEHRAAALAVWDRALAGEEFTVIEEFGDHERARPCYELRFNPLRDREGRQVGAFQYAVDVTKRLRAQAQLAQAEEQLRQAQKMEAVGQLTGGIAHDFNNLLTGVIGSLEMMQRRLGQGQLDRVERYATAAITSANRAAALTHRLLAFARRQPLDPKPVNANRLVTGMEELLRRTIGEAIRLEIVTAGGLWQTRCDPHQLESAILNLAINARDAMPSGGKLTIETCNARLDDAYAARSREVRPGQYVCVCVTDTGTGMSPDVIARAFEPFFTTKPIGQGTGLGLSMIYGFARQSEGYAKIYSEPGQGTTVKLYLPRYYGEAEDAGEEVGELTGAHRAEHGEVVLVVEDETAVRALVVDVLGSSATGRSRRRTDWPGCDCSSRTCGWTSSSPMSGCRG